MQKVKFIDLGLIDFKQAWDYQEKLFAEVVNTKVANRTLPENEQQPTDSFLVFCEHPHVYTLGKTGDKEHLLISENQLKDKNASYYKINRGGDITYHGPGQIVGYPILDLDNFFTDIHKYLRFLEEMVIRTLAEYGLVGERSAGETGVWLDATNPAKARKICALGVRASRWVTMHGFALNINVDLNYFGNIIPCGIIGKAVTSLDKELGRMVDETEVKQKLKQHFSELFLTEFI
jgi:lipoyl(octanoyl) transferase